MGSFLLGVTTRPIAGPPSAEYPSVPSPATVEIVKVGWPCAAAIRRRTETAMATVRELSTMESCRAEMQVCAAMFFSL